MLKGIFYAKDDTIINGISFKKNCEYGIIEDRIFWIGETDEGSTSEPIVVTFNELKENFYYSKEYTMDFSDALREIKKGRRMKRLGWNGKNMSVVYQKGYPEGINCNKQTAEAWGINEGDLFKCEPYLQISTADGSHAMWVPSIRDLLAEDWVWAD